MFWWIQDPNKIHVFVMLCLNCSPQRRSTSCRIAVPTGSSYLLTMLQDSQLPLYSFSSSSLPGLPGISQLLPQQPKQRGHQERVVGRGLEDWGSNHLRHRIHLHDLRLHQLHFQGGQTEEGSGLVFAGRPRPCGNPSRRGASLPAEEGEGQSDFQASQTRSQRQSRSPPPSQRTAPSEADWVTGWTSDQKARRQSLVKKDKDLLISASVHHQWRVETWARQSHKRPFPVTKSSTERELGAKFQVSFQITASFQDG